ncbi:MAG: uroporphyrinogen methyltransferase / synthase, partial [Thermoleophilaceae bacterium]|nr:uroporphyrinogen methyltransferase / synthase [Thermoleophilaceae bacterium]
DAQLVYAGKTPGGESMGQDEINRRLVELGLQGLNVVRLKGGDPFVFGRGGEEAQALVAAGVPFEVVPGVTAGVAGPAYAGIPATHRDESSAVALITAHEDPAKPESAVDWAALARFPGTLVFYMGVKRLPEVTARLIEEGRPPSEPAAVVERATLPGQRTVRGSLEDIASAAAEAGVKPPAITIVGSVTALSEDLAWIERRPLHGTTVVVTRARAQASGLAQRLRELGADVIETPAIRIQPRPIEGDVARAADEISDYALVCLTSPNAVDLLFDALEARGKDSRALAGVTVAAIGPGSARALAARGIRADVVPERSIGEALVEELAGIEVEGRRVLVARASEARDLVPDALRGRGAQVDVVALYDTVAEPLDPAQLQGIGRADRLTFTSSSTVRYFLEGLRDAGASIPEGRVISIGPVTSDTARELGLAVHREATEHDIDGLVAAVLEDSA